METCIFCDYKDEVLFENETCYVILDQYPVTKGHLLIIPKSHKSDYFALSPKEKSDMALLVEQGKTYLDDSYAPKGYNLGFNCGEVAGQTIFHCHCHLIPRYLGDTANPKGGVRGVIPDKKAY